MPRYITDEDTFRVLSEYYHHRTDIQRMALSEAISRVPTADVVEKQLYNRLLENATIISEALNKYQTADVPERNVGKWIENTEYFPTTYTCPFCGYKIYRETTDFCPSCGADLREE